MAKKPLYKLTCNLCLKTIAFNFSTPYDLSTKSYCIDCCEAIVETTNYFYPNHYYFKKQSLLHYDKRSIISKGLFNRINSSNYLYTLKNNPESLLLIKSDDEIEQIETTKRKLQNE